MEISKELFQKVYNFSTAGRLAPKKILDIDCDYKIIQVTVDISKNINNKEKCLVPEFINYCRHWAKTHGYLVLTTFTHTSIYKNNYEVCSYENFTFQEDIEIKAYQWILEQIDAGTNK